MIGEGARVSRWQYDKGMDIKQLLHQDALVAAPQLLGWEITTGSPDGDTGGIIIEVEAYHGAEDPASHAYRGLTARTQPMFGPAGNIYVYFTYGMHYCTNLVTGPDGQAQAILLRGLWPTSGLEIMARRRGGVALSRLTNGPANLTQALGIQASWSGRHLHDGLITLRPPQSPVDPSRIMAGPRIGIKQATDWPWRFWLQPDPEQK